MHNIKYSLLLLIFIIGTEECEGYFINYNDVRLNIEYK